MQALGLPVLGPVIDMILLLADLLARFGGGGEPPVELGAAFR